MSKAEFEIKLVDTTPQQAPAGPGPSAGPDKAVQDLFSKVSPSVLSRLRGQGAISDDILHALGGKGAAASAPKSPRLKPPPIKREPPLPDEPDPLGEIGRQVAGLRGLFGMLRSVMPAGAGRALGVLSGGARAAQGVAGVVGAAGGGGAAGGAAAGAAGAGGGAAAAGVGAIGAAGPIGIAVAAAVAVWASIGVAAKKFVDTLNEQSDKLAEYSPEISQAKAQSELRLLRNDFERSQRFGNGLASFERFRGRVDEDIAKVQTEMLGILVRIWETVEPAASTLLTGVEVVGSFATSTTKIMEKMLEIQLNLLNPARILELLKEAQQEALNVSKNIAQIIQEARDDELHAGFDDPFFNSLKLDLFGRGGVAFGPAIRDNLPPGEPGV